MRLNTRLPEVINEQIYQSIGQASMCWENVDKAGVFDSIEASKISDTLCNFIADKLEEGASNGRPST